MEKTYPAEAADLRARLAKVKALLDELRDPNPEADQDWHDDPVGCIADALDAALAPTADTADEALREALEKPEEAPEEEFDAHRRNNGCMIYRRSSS